MDTSTACHPVVDTPNLVSFWDFQEPAGQPRVSRGPCPYALKEMAGPVARVADGIFGPYAAFLDYRQWMSIARADCPALNINGPDAQVTVLAWIRRHRKPEIECEFVAGIWNETNSKRQYGLFLDLRIHQGADQVGGHVSSLGGPTPGHKYCMDAAIGGARVSYFGDWKCVGFTYDGESARAYLNGTAHPRDTFNPYHYPGGLYDGGPNGANFTVGAVDRGGSIGNWFTGHLGGLAIFDRALSADEMVKLASVVIS